MGIDHDQPIPWLYIVPEVFSVFGFKVMHEEIYKLVYQAEPNSLVFMQKTPSCWRKGMERWKLHSDEAEPLG